MITLQNGAAAFLKHNGQYLLIKRAPGRKIAPNVWSGVGGHIEQHELNNPTEACLREIYEETGISKDHIFNMELRYLIIRRSKDVIRQNYIYFGETDIVDFVDTDEGTLHWVPEPELFKREFTKTFDAMLHHYIDTPDNMGRVVVGTAQSNSGNPKMIWSHLEDWE